MSNETKDPMDDERLITPEEMNNFLKHDNVEEIEIIEGNTYSATHKTMGEGYVKREGDEYYFAPEGEMGAAEVSLDDLTIHSKVPADSEDVG